MGDVDEGNLPSIVMGVERYILYYQSKQLFLTFKRIGCQPEKAKYYY